MTLVDLLLLKPCLLHRIFRLRPISYLGPICLLHVHLSLMPFLGDSDVYFVSAKLELRCLTVGVLQVLKQLLGACILSRIVLALLRQFLLLPLEH